MGVGVDISAFFAVVGRCGDDLFSAFVSFVVVWEEVVDGFGDVGVGVDYPVELVCRSDFSGGCRLCHSSEYRGSH